MSYINAKNLVVEFPIYGNPQHSIKQKIFHATTGGRLAQTSAKQVSVRALDELNFEIKDGDRVGLIGHNGSGKTTLLRTLVGAYEPTSGYLETRGKIASLLDIFMGMDQEATGYDNIFMRGIMMGLNQKQIAEKAEEIAEFTNLGEYLSMPVRTYSSGMHLRLAFAVSTCVKAEIIIMDEWLSVGDTEFAEKASKRLNKLVDNASILVIATHSQELLYSLCNRVIRLEHGRIAEEFST